MLLASSVEVSSLLPYFSVCSSFFHLWSGIHRKSRSRCIVILYSPVGPSLGHAQGESLSSWVTTCSGGARLLLFRTSLLRNNGKGQRIHLSQLVLGIFPTRFLHPRIRPNDVSVNLSLLEIVPCDHRLQSPCQCLLKSRLRPRAPRGFLIWHCVMRRWNWQVH